MDIEERLQKYLGQEPQIDPTAFVSKNAVLMGAVKIGANASVWPGCVLRALVRYNPSDAACADN